MDIFDSSINLLESAMIGVFFFRLFPKKNSKIAFFTVCFILIEFIYIQLANYCFGITDGLFSSIDILISFTFLGLSRQFPVSIAFLLALMPTLLISISNIFFQVILVFVFGIDKWMYVLFNHITYFSLLFLVIHGVSFFAFARLFEKHGNHFSGRTYFTSSLVLIGLIFLLRSIELYIHNASEIQNVYLILFSGIFFCILIFNLFVFVMIDMIARMKKEQENIIKRDFDYYHLVIKEKERYLNELKHNVNLYLNLLSSGNDNSVLKKEEKMLRNILSQNSKVIIEKNPAIAIAINAATKGYPSQQIKLVYLLSKTINIPQIDLYTIISMVLEQAIACAYDNSSIEISVEEVHQKCRIMITLQEQKVKLTINKSIRKQIEKSGGESFVVLPDRIIIVLPILLS